MTHDGVEVQGTGGHERLPFASLHLRDVAKVERDTSKELFGEGLQPYETAGRFSYQREGFRQQLGLGGACSSPLSELGSISLQTLIVEHDQRRLEFKDLWNYGLVCFEFTSSWGKRAEQSHQTGTSTERTSGLLDTDIELDCWIVTRFNPSVYAVAQYSFGVAHQTTTPKLKR